MANLKLYDFQEKAVTKLMESTFTDERTILVKSPTGSGKTIILINLINEYLNEVCNNTAFIWLCPGKGDLEVQSMNKMQTYFPQRNIQDLNTALNQGFTPESTTFINWEMVTKTGNRSITDGEKKNLFERIAEAHRTNIDFIVIIDEEHSNNTSKANDIINALSAKKIIRVSATTQNNPRFEYYEIKEDEVIASGLISKAIYINEGINAGEVLGDDYDKLLTLADSKRKEIAQAYKNLNKAIRPLVLIQFPNAQPETILQVEQKLTSMGYTYDNGMVAKWTANEKKNLTNSLTNNDGEPIFLLMKQAITTGWDCPRAKILVKLREGMEQDFEIQTIGRIRRMPERIHYDNTVLDCCYVYTYDEKWKSGLVKSCERAYELTRLFLKDKCKTFRLIKQLKNKNESTGLGERETYLCLFKHFESKYRITNDKNQNKSLLEANDYIFGNQLRSALLQGRFHQLTNVATDQSQFIDVIRDVNTHQHGILLRHSIDKLKKIVGLDWKETHVVLRKLFRKKTVSKSKILSLPTNEFYAFIINNIELLEKEFTEASGLSYRQARITMHPKEEEFRIPLQDWFKTSSNARRPTLFESNSYEEYTSANCASPFRSNCEIMFEKYCENNNNVDWVYKNGDTGQQYFSIVYLTSYNKQYLFYADYIVKMKNGSIWIIETKGGEVSGEDRNIDIQTENKFNAFKQYASAKNLNWGFVRYIDNDLFINNTVYNKDMSDEEHWIPLNEILN